MHDWWSLFIYTEILIFPPQLLIITISYCLYNFKFLDSIYK